MAELTAAIGANDTRIFLDEPLPKGTYFRIDDELVAVTSRAYRTALTVTGLIVSIKRGMQGTTPAAHDAGAEVELYVDAFATPLPFAGAGGGVTVDNQDDPPAEVSTLIVPGATISGDEATLPSGLQQTRLLGPFDIPFDIPDESTWPDVEHFGDTLTAGTLILGMLVSPTAEWVSVSADVTLNLGIGVPGDIDNTGNDLFSIAVRTSGASTGFVSLPWIGTKVFQSALTNPEVTRDRPGIMVAAGQLLAYLTQPCSAGSLRVYVLIAEPTA